MSALRRIDVAAVIDAAPFAGLPLWVTALSFVIVIFDGFDLQAAAFVAPALAAQWGVKRELLGPVLAASLVGMAVGSVALGWLGDRIGRKRAFCICIALLCAGSAASTVARSLTELVQFRFATGVGLGGAVPLAALLMSEWAPTRWRSIAVGVVVVGVPLGGLLGAALAAHLIPAYGWRAVFAAGAAGPLLCLALAVLLLPESPKYLAGRGGQGVRLARVLNRLHGTAQFSGEEQFFISEAPSGPRGSIITLLQAPHLATTLLLWIAFSCNTLALYGFVNWLPTVLSSAGLPLQAALGSSVWFNSGGLLGSVGGSVLIRRYGSRLIGSSMELVGAAAALGIGATAALAASAHALGASLLALVLVAGASLNGMQTFLYAVSAHSYPTAVRSTGMGCASAVARVGGVLSSAVGSAFFALGLPVAQFFYILAVVVLVTAASFFALRSHIPGVAGAKPARIGAVR
jgi:AAHS family 4-hydroxybenzoate transporter-like MFS transporter